MSAKITSIVNIKGGVGKSTLAIHIATELSAFGYRTLLVDTDRQRTTRFWHDWRAQQHADGWTVDLMTPIDPWQAGAYNCAIVDKSAQYDHIIIDTAGFESGIMREIMLTSDLILIPSMVSQAEILSTADTIEKAREQALEPYVVWARIPATTSQKKRIAECQNMLGTPALRTIIHQRQAYLDALELGLVVAEIESQESLPAHKRRGAAVAAQEISHITKEILSIFQGEK